MEAGSNVTEAGLWISSLPSTVRSGVRGAVSDLFLSFQPHT